MSARSELEMRSMETPGTDAKASSEDNELRNTLTANSDFNKASWTKCCLISAWPFTIHFGLVDLVTSALGSYLTSQLTTIEKQFGLSSTESGLLASMNDAGFLVTVLFVAYLGRNSHIPRILGFCGIFYGISALITIIPHFFADHDLGYSPITSNLTMNFSANNMGQFCSTETPKDPSVNGLSCSEKDKRFTAAKSLAMTLISIGMFLQGAAKSPRQPLSQTYLDDNLEKTKTGLYIGIILCLAVLGSAIAYSVGGSISRIFVTLEATDMSPRDPRFIGAWWLGFAIFGFISVLLSLPLLCYPKRMQYSIENKVNKPVKTVSRESGPKWKFAIIKAVLLAFKRLATRPVYVLLVTGSTVKVFSVAGILSFTPKFMQIHYGLSIYKANLIIGFASIGSAGLAIFLSGVLTRVLKLELKGMIKTLLITQTISSALFFSGIFLRCPQPPIQDFDMIIMQSKIPILSSANSSASCYAACQCESAKFFPICGSNGVTYFSPCHAGCSGTGKTGYTDCSCINSTSSIIESAPSPDAVPGMCKEECPLYITFIVIQLVSSFLSGLSVVPASLALIRASDERDKSLALGADSFATSSLGWFLGPIGMGALIDTTCKLWNTSCSKDGSCAVYDIADLRVKLHSVAGGISAIYIALMIIACICVGRRQKSKSLQTKVTK